MSCNAYNTGANAKVTFAAASLPADFVHVDWPTTLAAIVAALVGSLPGGFSTFTIGSNTPSVDDRDKLWFKVDASCVPIGWYIYYGGAWVRAVPHPVLPGTIIDYYNAVFAGYVGSQAVIDGLVSDYVLTLDGGDASSPFWRLCDGTNGTPDLRARVRVGAGLGGSPLSARVQGATGGEETHVLQIAELPAFIPSFPTGTAAGTGAVMRATSNGTTENGTAIGASTAHQNMPPYYAVYPIIRTARVL